MVENQGSVTVDEMRRKHVWRVMREAAEVVQIGSVSMTPEATLGALKQTKWWESLNDEARANLERDLGGR